ncbi:MAG: hypothetical protein ACON36_04500 [Ilumatobacteraceae bacterium]
MDSTQTPRTASNAEPRNAPDAVMRKILRLDQDAPRSTPDEARKAFQTSILVATVRCLLMYIVFPFVLPALGIATGVGPAIGLAIGIAAIAAIIMSVRRFWRADHSKRWHYTIVGTFVVAFLLVLVVGDIINLVS